MASADQLEQWKAMGGKVEAPAKKGNTKKESVFIAPTGERCWGSVLLRSRALLTSCARERFPAGEKLKSWNDAAKILAQSDKDSAPEAKPSAEDKGGSGPDTDLFEFAALNAAPGSAAPEESRH